MDDFQRSLAEWVRSFCDASDKRRKAAMMVQNRESDISRLQIQVGQLELKVARKPRVARQIAELKHQIRHLELEIAFAQETL